VKQHINATVEKAVEEEAADLRVQVAGTLEHFAEQLQQQNRHLQDFTAAMQTQTKESFGFMTQRMVEAEDTALERQTELEARMNDRPHEDAIGFTYFGTTGRSALCAESHQLRHKI
jgi:hypothetical protein